MSITYNCTYCGGWVDQAEGEDYTAPTALVLEDHTPPDGPGERREICIRCFIKAFDRALNRRDP